ncbi:glycosyltransferase family A protein [uncultured Arcobacter sp.]|uniref:glycosyltransferase n=1 Tax=uncultured Arcobacter sp. TaxID=165434 RepID=UPI002621EC1E|nr:glycosyltransferase family A protein [uncultured Arcobacter sp.]
MKKLKTSLPKVLVATTVYEDKDYIFDKFLDNARNLDYPNFHVLIVDNSKTRDYYKVLKKKTKNMDNVTIVHVPRGKHSREGVANGLNYIRDYVINNDYDYWMSIESDLIPPKNIISRLMMHQKPIVGCMYVIGYIDNEKQPPRPCLFQLRRQKNGELETYNLPPQEGYEYFGKGLTKVHGCGIGTALMHKFLLKKIKFWYMDSQIKHSDVFMYMDLHNMGYDVWLDSDIIIPHYNSKWDNVKDI